MPETCKSSQPIDPLGTSVELLRHTIVSLVRQEAADLTARQLSIFLICYHLDVGQTVRGLAVDLKISRPAVTRALDRLEKFKLALRQTDPQDGRSVLVCRTARGRVFLRKLQAITVGA